MNVHVFPLHPGKQVTQNARERLLEKKKKKKKKKRKTSVNG